MIVRWPGVVRPGSICDAPACSIDFFPTICEATGAALPGDREIDGVSLMPLLEGERNLSRDALYWHFPHYRGSDVQPYSIVRSGDWKLIKRYDGKPFELFNLREDMGERADLAEAMPGKVEELDWMLSGWLERVGARMPRPNPDYIGDS
jgi:arylsulfatase A-like enzyme